MSSRPLPAKGLFGALPRLGLFLLAAAGLLFFNYSLELGEPLKPVVSYVFYATEFGLVFFLLARRRRLPALLASFTPPALRESLSLACLALLAFAARLALAGSPLLRLPLTLLGLALLLPAFLGLAFLRSLFTGFRRELALALAFFAFLTLLGQTFYTNWLFLGTFTARIVKHLIDLTLGQGVLDLSKPDYPVVGRQPFIAVIYPECSGIQSLLLFSALYVLAVAVDFKELDKRKAALAYLAGMLGMFIVTVLRIYFIIVAGVLFSVDFAIQFVHSTISLVLFVLYFTAFWKLAFKRIRKAGHAPA